MRLSGVNRLNTFASQIVRRYRDGFEVIRIHAAAIAAEMIKLKSFRNSLATHEEGISMSPDYRSQRKAPMKLAIALSVLASCPKPTTLGPFDLRPESGFFGWADGSEWIACAIPPEVMNSAKPFTDVNSRKGAVKNVALGVHRESSFLGVMGRAVCAVPPFYFTSSGS